MSKLLFVVTALMAFATTAQAERVKGRVLGVALTDQKNVYMIEFESCAPFPVVEAVATAINDKDVVVEFIADFGNRLCSPDRLKRNFAPTLVDHVFQEAGIVEKEDSRILIHLTGR